MRRLVLVLCQHPGALQEHLPRGARVHRMQHRHLVGRKEIGEWSKVLSAATAYSTADDLNVLNNLQRYVCFQSRPEQKNQIHVELTANSQWPSLGVVSTGREVYFLTTF